MELKRAIIPFDIKADINSTSGTFEGYGSIFGNIDLGGDIVFPGAFTKTLQEWKLKNELPAMYGFHDSSNPIGDWINMAEDEKGLYVQGELWVNGDKRVEQAVVAHNLIKGTGPKGLSIGYLAKDYEFQEFESGTIRFLKEIDLYEVSVVGFAMNPIANVTSVKKLIDDDGKLLTKRDVEKVLRDAGLSRRQSKAFIAAGYDAVSRDDESTIEGAERDAGIDLENVSQALNNLLDNIRKG